MHADAMSSTKRSMWHPINVAAIKMDRAYVFNRPTASDSIT